MDTQPFASSTLGRNESFYVRIEYATDEPLMLWVRPNRSDNPLAFDFFLLLYFCAGMALAVEGILALFGAAPALELGNKRGF